MDTLKNEVDDRVARPFSGPLSDRPAAQRGAPTLRGLWGLLLVICLLCSAFIRGIQAQARPSEFQVKAAYLYNFGKFVRWPENSTTASDSSFVICVLGKDPFQGALDAVVAGQTIAGSPVAVKQIDGIRQISACRVLYVNGDEVRRFRSVLDSVRHRPVITVSDAPEFLQDGGFIQFVFVGDKVRFAINLDAAHEAGVQLSAELLKVATKVVRNNLLGTELH